MARFKRGSKAAKRFMARLRRMRKGVKRSVRKRTIRITRKIIRRHRRRHTTRRQHQPRKTELGSIIALGLIGGAGVGMLSRSNPPSPGQTPPTQGSPGGGSMSGQGAASSLNPSLNASGNYITPDVLQLGLAGSGYTPSGLVYIENQSGTQIASVYADSSGSFIYGLSTSVLANTPAIFGYDVATGAASVPIYLSYQTSTAFSPSGGSPTLPLTTFSSPGPQQGAYSPSPTISSQYVTEPNPNNNGWIISGSGFTTGGAVNIRTGSGKQDVNTGKVIWSSVDGSSTPNADGNGNVSVRFNLNQAQAGDLVQATDLVTGQVSNVFAL